MPSSVQKLLFLDSIPIDFIPRNSKIVSKFSYHKQIPSYQIITIPEQLNFQVATKYNTTRSLGGIMPIKNIFYKL